MKTKTYKIYFKTAVSLLICASCVFVLFFSAPQNISASSSTIDSELQKLQDSLDKAEADRKAAEKAYNKAKSDKADVAEEKTAIDKEIDYLEKEYAAIESLIAEYEKQIENLSSELSLMETELKTNMGILKDHIRVSYENDISNYLEILLDSDSLYEFLTQAERVTYLLEYDKKLISECDRACEEIKTKREAVFELKREADEQKTALLENKKKLDDKQTYMAGLMENLEKDMKNAYELYQKAYAEEQAFDKKIEELLAERQKQTNSIYVGGDFIWPLPAQYMTVTSNFGERIHPVTKKPQFHKGIDISAPYKTPIYCINNGTVIETGNSSANGKYVIVDHGGGVASFYAHLSTISVSVGNKLKQGAQIGLVGMTGLATGYHLHLSLYVNNTAVDPLEYYKLP